MRETLRSIKELRKQLGDIRVSEKTSEDDERRVNKL
jgi:hypothetical protein